MIKDALMCIYLISYRILYVAFVIINMYILIQLYINIYICINHPTHISDSSCRILEKACLDNHISVCSAFLSRDATDPAEILCMRKNANRRTSNPDPKRFQVYTPGNVLSHVFIWWKRGGLMFEFCPGIYLYFRHPWFPCWCIGNRESLFNPAILVGKLNHPLGAGFIFPNLGIPYWFHMIPWYIW